MIKLDFILIIIVFKIQIIVTSDIDKNLLESQNNKDLAGNNINQENLANQEDYRQEEDDFNEMDFMEELNKEKLNLNK